MSDWWSWWSEAARVCQCGHLAREEHSIYWPHSCVACASLNVQQRCLGFKAEYRTTVGEVA